jgi:hypothetical protein
VEETACKLEVRIFKRDAIIVEENLSVEKEEGIKEEALLINLLPFKIITFRTS